MRRALCILAAVIIGSPVAAQPAAPSDRNGLSIKPFAMTTVQRFSADATFDAVFGRSTGALFGGGVLVTHRKLFIEVMASRFKSTGERGFAADGEGFGLDIPLTVSIRPVEIAAGYRFRPVRPSIVPYLGAGFGFYRYTESSSSDQADEELDVSHAGWLLVGGAEFRLHRWLALGADVQYSSVPGVLGQGGLSQEVGEGNLGGIAVRVKVIVGR